MEARTLLNAGDLDPTFGAGGKVLTDFGTGSTNKADAVALQSDGKIIVAGKTQATSSSRSLFAVARYNPDGSLDAGFGNGGKVTTDFDPLSAEPIAVDLQPDGKIVVVGQGPGATNKSINVFLSRYNADGTLDIGFGTAGKVMDSVTSAAPYPVYSIPIPSGGATLQPDGRIVVASGPDIIRYNVDGSRDLSFGSGGAAQVTNFETDDIAVQPDGKIVAGIQSGYLVRLNADGSPDPTFGNFGGALAFPSNGDSVVLQPDSRILTTRLAPFSPLRFNVNGTPDSTFAETELADFYGILAPLRLALQPDDRVVMAFAGFGVSLRGSFLFRYNPDGSHDARFGSNGMVTVDFGNGSMTTVAGVAIEPDGKIVAVATVSGTTTNIGLVRYLGDDRITDPIQHYVSQLYLDLLQRPVDPSGLATWTGFLMQGNPRASLVQAIESGPEYRNLVVNDLFGYVLGRPVDDSGRRTWVGFLNQGGTAEQLRAFLLASDEYFNASIFRRTHGNGTNDAFLAGLYGDVLHRGIDPAGVQSWGQALSNGASRSAVAASVLASLESDQMEVQGLYNRFLRRSADSGGLETFTGSLQKGVPNEAIIATLLGSDEYFALVLSLP